MANTYRTVYSFDVIDLIRQGNDVYMLDRLKHAVECVTNMEVGDFACILETSKEEPTRFEFWVIDKTEG